MILDKAIRRRQLTQPQVGSHVMETEDLSTEPRFQLGPAYSSPLFVEELEGWPEVLDLLIRWNAVPLVADNIYMQEVVDDVALAERSYYEPAAADQPQIARFSAYKCIELHAVEGETVDVQGPIYTKTFAVQSPAKLIQVRRSLGDGKYRVTAPKGQQADENLVPLLAYGMYAPPGCALADIDQVYGTIGASGKGTSLRLHMASQLRREGIIPPGGGVVNDWRYCFLDPNTQSSVVADILQQRLEVPVKQGDHTRTYVSVGYRDTSPADRLITITFKPK